MKFLEVVFQRVYKILCLWVVMLAAFYAAPACAQSYSIINLGVLRGGTYSFGTGLNDEGEATGYGDASQGSVRAWRYSHGALIDLGTLGTSYSLTYPDRPVARVTLWLCEP